MRVFRIAKARYIDDLSGIGARLHGGRWNPKGISIVYTSLSRALATVEYLVHVPIAFIPKGLRIATLEIPDDVVPEGVEITDLPGNWRQYPAPPELAEIGRNWVLLNTSLLLQAPSAVVEGEYNILINPAHPDMRRVTVVEIQPYDFDRRLAR
jgi:RES domain-containing protein